MARTHFLTHSFKHSLYHWSTSPIFLNTQPATCLACYFFPPSSVIINELLPSQFPNHRRHLLTFCFKSWLSISQPLSPFFSLCDVCQRIENHCNLQALKYSDFIKSHNTIATFNFLFIGCMVIPIIEYWVFLFQIY
jgi:hypothetical protein